MGVVLLGRDVDLGRDLAVKVLLEQHRDDPETVRRFVEEAQIGGQLQHPGIVPVHELGRLPDGRLFIAMKLFRGRTLAALLRERRDPADDLPRFLGVFEQICQAMAYAHTRGVVHRDLKPSNVMVGSFGEVQVMDWGLAKVLDRGGVADEERPLAGRDDGERGADGADGVEAGDSRADAVLGTPAYMAPEQARGALDTLDERADVFGLGSILCEILTGPPAYAGPTDDALYGQAVRADLADAYARLDACDADVELVALARSCLAPAPKDRPRDAGVVLAGLTGHLANVRQRLHDAELAQAEAEARASEEQGRRELADELATRRTPSGRRAKAADPDGGPGRVGARHHPAGRGRLGPGGTRPRGPRPPDGRRGRGGPGQGRRSETAGQVVRRGMTRPAGSGRPRPPAAPSCCSAAAWVVSTCAAASATCSRCSPPSTGRPRRSPRTGTWSGVWPASTPRSALHLGRASEDAQYASAFRGYGIPVDALGPAEAGARIAARPIAVDLAGALDHWAFSRRRARPPRVAEAQHLVRVAYLADPDPWRNQLRDALDLMTADRARARAELERLAASADAYGLTASSAERLAWALADLGNREAAVALYRAAQRAHPDDFWINSNLASELIRQRHYDEAVRFASVAVALHPRGAQPLVTLGWALHLAGRTDDAAATLREALGSGPRTPPPSPHWRPS